MIKILTKIIVIRIFSIIEQPYQQLQTVFENLPLVTSQVGVST